MAEPTTPRAAASDVEPDLRRLAWTRDDGPGQPPAGANRLAVGALAGSLVLGATGILTTDTLCPEHRTWVLALGIVVLVGSFATGAALLANRPMSALYAVVPALAGVAIGVIDATHNSTRGTMIAALFAAAILFAASMTASGIRTIRWNRTLAQDLRPFDGTELAKFDHVPSGSDPAEVRSVDELDADPPTGEPIDLAADRTSQPVVTDRS